jgi:hypothetical protein
MNDETKSLQLDFTVLNTQVRPREHLRGSLTADVSGLARDVSLLRPNAPSNTASK